MKMQYLQFIKELAVERASYRLHDGNGTVAVLIVDYKNNTYTIKNGENMPNNNFKIEAEKLAAGLLARKHAANLAKREQYI